MKIIAWEKLPQNLRTEQVKEYYDLLSKRTMSLIIKRAFDIVVSLLMLIILSPVILILALCIKLDSKGPVFFRQVRITRYGKKFRIFKFRTMVANAEKLGSQVTVANDNRITKVGSVIRRFRLDEIPQLFNIIAGDMSFVGARPEVEKYVDRYTDVMNATLLMPAGLTSLASIKFKDEESMLNSADNVDDTYVNDVLPLKMKYNLEYVKQFSFISDIKLMFMTALAVCGINVGVKTESEKTEVDINA